MRYVIANKALAVDAGFPTVGHRVQGNLILLNEKELMCSAALTGTIDERAAAIEGTVYTHEGINYALQEGGWQ